MATGRVSGGVSSMTIAGTATGTGTFGMTGVVIGTTVAIIDRH
jgi:hypothetical protein